MFICTFAAIWFGIFHLLLSGLDDAWCLPGIYLVSIWGLFGQVSGHDLDYWNFILKVEYRYMKVFLTSTILFNCTFWDSVPDGSLQWSSSCLVCAYHLYRCKTSILWRAVWHACPDHETVGMSRHEWEGKRGRFPVPAHIHTYIYYMYIDSPAPERI